MTLIFCIPPHKRYYARGHAYLNWDASHLSAILEISGGL